MHPSISRQLVRQCGVSCGFDTRRWSHRSMVEGDPHLLCRCRGEQFQPNARWFRGNRGRDHVRAHCIGSQTGRGARFRPDLPIDQLLASHARRFDHLFRTSTQEGPTQNGDHARGQEL
jgi:hypothetical protein